MFVSKSIRSALAGFVCAALFVLSGCGGGAATPPERENPYKDVRLGDWTQYKMTQTKAGTITEKTVKNTVTKVDEDSFTLEMSGDVKQSKMIFRSSYDPYEVPGADVYTKHLGTGTEKINVGGKDYDCTWYEVEVTLGNSETPWKYKEWISKTVPLNQKVKSIMTGPSLRTEHALIDSGRGK